MWDTTEPSKFDISCIEYNLLKEAKTFMPVPPLQLTRQATHEYAHGQVGRRFYGIIDLRPLGLGNIYLGAGAEGDQPDGSFGRKVDRFRQWFDKKRHGFDHAPVRKGHYKALDGELERGVPGHEQLMRKLGFRDRTEGLGFALTKGGGGPSDLFFESMLNQENLPGGAENPRQLIGKGFKYERVDNGRGFTVVGQTSNRSLPDEWITALIPVLKGLAHFQ